MVATEAPTTCWTRAQDSIITALSQSASFRSIVDAADATAALAVIFGQRVTNPESGYLYTDDELKAFSYAQVYSAPDTPYGWTNNGGGFLRHFGNAVLYIDRRVTELESNSYDEPLGIERWLENRIGTTLTEVHAYLEANSGPYITGVQVTEGPATNPPDERATIGLRQRIEILVAWGYQ